MTSKEGGEAERGIGSWADPGRRTREGAKEMGRRGGENQDKDNDRGEAGSYIRTPEEGEKAEKGIRTAQDYLEADGIRASKEGGRQRSGSGHKGGEAKRGRTF